MGKAYIQLSGDLLDRVKAIQLAINGNELRLSKFFGISHSAISRWFTGSTKGISRSVYVKIHAASLQLDQSLHLPPLEMALEQFQCPKDFTSVTFRPSTPRFAQFTVAVPVENLYEFRKRASALGVMVGIAEGMEVAQPTLED